MVINGQITKIRAEHNADAGIVFGGSSGTLTAATMTNAISTNNDGREFWIQCVGEIRGDGLRAEYNREEGVRVLRSAAIKIKGYRATGNAEPDSVPAG